MFVALKNKMKKALIIAYNDLNNSGVPNVIYQTIKALHEQYSFDVLVFGDDDHYYQKLKNEGINIRLIKYIDKKPRSTISRLLWWFYKMPHNHFVYMKKLLKENNYDVIHSFKEYYSWPFFKAAKNAKIEKRILHRNINPEKPKQLVIKVLESKNRRLSIKYSSDLVGVSEVSCKNAFGNNKYTVLYNSYYESKYNNDVKNKLLNDELVITQVASYSDNKNQLFSLQVLKELKKIHDNIKLNLVGASEKIPYYQSLIDYVHINNLEDSVSFIDRSDTVEKIYEKTTFVIIPSLREGFSLVAVEAQACGMDVFASSSIPKEVDCGGVNFLDLSKGPDYWAKEIYKKFLSQHNLRSFYGTSKFSFERFKRELENLYK